MTWHDVVIRDVSQRDRDVMWYDLVRWSEVTWQCGRIVHKLLSIFGAVLCFRYLWVFMQSQNAQKDKFWWKVIKNITQTAKINFVLQRMLIQKLTFRMLSESTYIFKSYRYMFGKLYIANIRGLEPRLRKMICSSTHHHGGLKLVRSSPDRAVRVRALAGDIVLCSCALNSHGASLRPGV